MLIVRKVKKVISKLIYPILPILGTLLLSYGLFSGPKPLDIPLVGRGVPERITETAKAIAEREKIYF